MQKKVENADIICKMTFDSVESLYLESQSYWLVQVPLFVPPSFSSQNFCR